MYHFGVCVYTQPKAKGKPVTLKSEMEPITQPLHDKKELEE